MILDFAVITVFNGERALTLFGGVTTTDVRLSNARVPLPHRHGQAEIDGLAMELASRQSLAAKDQPEGYAGLDQTGRVQGSVQRYGTLPLTAAEGNDPRIVSPDRILTEPSGVPLIDHLGNILWGPA